MIQDLMKRNGTGCGLVTLQERGVTDPCSPVVLFYEKGLTPFIVFAKSSCREHFGFQGIM